MKNVNLRLNSSQTICKSLYIVAGQADLLIYSLNSKDIVQKLFKKCSLPPSHPGLP